MTYKKLVTARVASFLCYEMTQIFVQKCELFKVQGCASISMSNRITRWLASRTNFRREVVQMNTYEVLTLLFSGGVFLLALLTYIDRNHKRK